MLGLSRRHLLAVAAVVVMPPRVFAAAPELEVWKMRGCACCVTWAEHFTAAGFQTRLHELNDLDPVRAAAGVPADLGGCHTAKVEGYVVEGHVPVAAVQRLLAERPAISGHCRARDARRLPRDGDRGSAGSAVRRDRIRR